jgi:hypothetical protein
MELTSLDAVSCGEAWRNRLGPGRQIDHIAFLIAYNSDLSSNYDRGLYQWLRAGTKGERLSISDSGSRGDNKYEQVSIRVPCIYHSKGSENILPNHSLPRVPVFQIPDFN